MAEVAAGKGLCSVRFSMLIHTFHFANSIGAAENFCTGSVCLHSAAVSHKVMKTYLAMPPGSIGDDKWLAVYH